MSQESKTPRTDAEQFEAKSQDSVMRVYTHIVVNADFARQLERELAAVTEERDAFIASARIKEANSGWRPIETAPRDGSWFVTANAREKDGEYEVARFNPYMQDQYMQEADGRFRRERVSVMDFSSDNFHRATHWKPLTQPVDDGDARAA